MTDTAHPGGEGEGRGGPPDPMTAVAAILREQQSIAETERRRLRRRAFWWRLVALALIVAVALGAIFGGEDGVSGDQIARVSVRGVITDDKKRDALLEKLAEQESVKAVIVRIDSPGGTTVGGEALYETLRDLAEKKPVVAVMSEVAASAAYITALSTDRIFARGNTITASIGVIFTAPNFYRAIDSLGLEVTEVKSGEQKAEPSPYKPVDPAKLVAERILVEDSFAWFLDLVRERRGVDEATLGEVRDGRILTGRMALELSLIDEIGGESEAVAWLEAERGIDKDLPIVDRDPDEPKPGLLVSIVDDLLGRSSMAAAGWRLAPGPKLVSVAD